MDNVFIGSAGGFLWSVYTVLQEELLIQTKAKRKKYKGAFGMAVT